MTESLSKPPPFGLVSKRRTYGLRFISGKYTGGEVSLNPGNEIVVGRANDLQMILVEDMVSRRHARIFWDGDLIQIEDLGSTNGTFVNGEKIKSVTPLHEGDRILIGTNILKVVSLDGAPPAAPPQANNLENVASRRAHAQTATRTMSGSIEEIPLPDLLQLLHTSKKNGVLVVRTDEDTCRIYFRKGQIYHCSINDIEDLSALKGLFRILTWQKGIFDLELPDESKFPNEIDISVPELLMEGLRQIDEFNALKDQLPNLRSRIRIPELLLPSLRDLSPEELDVLQLAHNYGTLESVLNKSLAMDLDTAQLLVSLLKKEYLIVIA